jgi:hypothetical protein
MNQGQSDCGRDLECTDDTKEASVEAHLVSHLQRPLAPITLGTPAPRTVSAKSTLKTMDAISLRRKEV